MYVKLRQLKSYLEGWIRDRVHVGVARRAKLTWTKEQVLE